MFVYFKILKARLLNYLGFVRLDSIFISASHECNAKCVHCCENYPNNTWKDSLETEEIKDIINQFKKLGGSLVLFCSGEFLLRSDAYELISYARSRKMVVYVTTNGLLIDERKIDELKEAGLTHLIVSLDNANEKEHDLKRGVEGCYKKAINALKLGRSRGMHTILWTYVSKSNNYNFEDLEKIIKLKDELGVCNVTIFFCLLSGRFFTKYEENLTLEDREAFRKRFNGRERVTLEFPTEKTICTGGGRHHINVMPSGEVTFCTAIPYSYGNIRTTPLKDILIELKKDYKRFSHCTGQCIVNFQEYREKNSGKFVY